MKILGIETSCDETAAAVVEDGCKVLSNVVVSQIDIHKTFGGVVPEVAARSHIEAILPVVSEAMKPFSWAEIDAIAVTAMPGLIGSLMVGVATAETLALSKQIPLYPVHHVLGHVYASFIGDNQPDFPFIALTVSGGHTQLVLFRDHDDFTVLGQTRDDAAGEAFDKVAKILGLSYPGGPAISEAAKLGDPKKYHLPKAKMQNPYDFSFSGLKTAVLRAVQAEVGKDFTFPSTKLSGLLSDSQRNDFAASFQKTAVDTLVDKLVKAVDEFQPKSVVICGGVAANQLLRSTALERLSSVKLHIPALEYCTDNAAMIATLAYYQSKFTQPVDPAAVEIIPALPLDRLKS